MESRLGEGGARFGVEDFLPSYFSVWKDFNCYGTLAYWVRDLGFG